VALRRVEKVLVGYRFYRFRRRLMRRDPIDE